MRKSSFGTLSVFQRHGRSLAPEVAQLWWMLIGLDPRRWPDYASQSLAELVQMARSIEKDALRGHINQDMRRLGLVLGDGPDVPRCVRMSLFIKKIRSTSQARSQAAVDEFLEIETSMRKRIRISRSLLHALNAIMREWLDDLDMSELPYTHGPGTTSEAQTELAGKYAALGTNSRLRRVFGDDMVVNQPEFVEAARLITVPKTVLVDRTICAEPATHMFYQKGQQIRLYDYICDHPYLRRHLPLRNQTRNRELAHKGSAQAWLAEHGIFVGNYATIDLKAASDYLSWYVVKHVFRNTVLARHLWATRSSAVILPRLGRLELKKFAPMGSALCFPIQSLVYAAVVEHVRRTSGLHLRPNDWAVFGDDIVCHTELSHNVMSILEHLGLKVNLEKSFTGSQLFRESCGGFYYDGDEIPALLCKEPQIRSQKQVSYFLDLGSQISRVDPLLGIWILGEAHARLPLGIQPYLRMGPEVSDVAFDQRRYSPSELQGRSKWSKAYQRRRYSQISYVRVSDESLTGTEEMRYIHTLLRYRRRSQIDYCSKRFEQLYREPKFRIGLSCLSLCDMIEFTLTEYGATDTQFAHHSPPQKGSMWKWRVSWV